MKVVQSLLGIQDASATHPHRFPSRARNHHSRDCAALLWDSCRAGAKKSLLLAALSFFTLPLLAGAPPCLTITCPPNTNVQCAADAPAAATDSTSFTAQGGTITNTCGGSLTVSSTDAITSSNCPNSFTITRTYTVTDNTGPTDAICAQTITVNDITPPVFTTCPASTNLGCNPGSVPGCDFSPANVATTDSCNSPTLTCILNQATNGCVRTRTITYKATDNCGNTNTCTQVITWTVDTTAPSITCPADTTTQCGQTTPNFTGLATATDDCGTNLVITFSDAATPGTCPTNSTITRTWKATDACNNVATCDQFITVLATAPPVFTNCPASTNLGCNPASVPGCNPAVGTTADCATTVTCVLNQVTNGCSRTRTITYTAVDACNNTNTCTQVVTWTVDTTPPVFLSCPTGTTNMGCNPDPASIPHCLVSVQATDDCSTPHVTCSLVQTTNLLTCVRTRTVIYTATDACGNSTNCTQVITWTVDTTPPVFTKIPLASTNLGCNPASIPVCNLDPTNVFAIDDCPTNDIPVITCASVEATNGCVHTRTLTYTATGGCGNTATKTTVITWTEDTAPPVFTKCPTNMNLGCNPTNAIPDCDTSTNNVVATDNCGAPTVTCLKSDAVSGDGCVHTRTITYAATDACNNSNTCVQVITWTTDTIPPVFTRCPASTNLGCNPASIPNCNLLSTNVEAEDVCSTPVITCAQVDSTTGCAHTRTITYTVTDACGNSNTCTQLISWTEDTTPPTIICPANTTAECGQTTTNFTGVATATDSCDTNVVITFTDASTPGNCPTNNTITRTWKAADACNNMATCDQIITVVDTTPPVFTNCPASTNLGCNPASIPGCDLAVGATDNCGVPTVTCVLNQVTNGCARTRTISYTATDACGNTNTCTQTITWTVDTTPPVFLNCPTGTTNMGCNPDPASIPHCLVSVQATDDCSTPHVTCSLVQTTNLLTCVRTRTVIYTATDACGNSTNCTQVITWTVDTTPPVFTKIPLASTNLGCNPASIPVCNLDPTNVFAIDDCPTNDIPVITCASVEATNGCVRTRTLTYTATGGCGNTATKTTVITWTEDTTPPVFTKIPLASTNLGCNPASIPVCDTSTNNVFAIDDCPSNSIAAITCASDDVTNGCVHTRTLTYTATGGCGNTATQTTVITWTEDTTPPTITCPTNTTAECGQTTTNFTGVATATDGCDTNVVITFSDVTSPGNCPTNRTITRTWKATDACGNMATCDQIISVVDTTPPTITCPTNRTAQCGQTTTNLTGVATATDICGTNVVITFSDVNTPGVCPTNHTITRTWTATDSCSNMATCDQIITVLDTTPPVLSNCPPASANLGCNPASIPNCNTYNVTATADCGATVNCASVDQTNGCAHTRTITYTAVDGCNNSNTCSQVLTWIEDITAPVFTNCPASTNLGCNPATIPNCDPAVGAADLCGATVTCAKVDLTNGCLRTRTITYTAKDGCNNSNTCTQVITWTVDTTPPVFTKCPTTKHLVCNPTTIPDCDTSTNNVAATDNCGTPIITCAKSDSVSGDGCEHIRTITYTATDACGNSNTCVQQIFWTTDTTPPVFTLCPTNMNLGCNPAGIPDCNTSTNNVLAVDNCGPPNLNCSRVDATNGCLRTRTITYTAIDACNNSATCIQVLNWTVDATPPVFTNCPPASTNLGCNPPSIPGCDPAVGATDDCGTPTVSCLLTQVTNGCVRIRTITYKATDACGNTNTCTQQITWTVDTTAPVFTNCPSPFVNLGCNPPTVPSCDPAVGVSDDCGATVSCARVDQTNGCARIRTLTYTAVDGCNNSNTCVQQITWTVDTTVPQFTNCPASTNLGCNPSSIPGCDPGVGAADNCSVPTVSCATVDATIGCTHTRTLTYTAVDACNNSNTCTQVITWTVDTTPPSITCPTNTTAQCGQTAPNFTGVATATDDCGTNVVITFSDAATPGTCPTNSTITRTWKATDACNNVATCDQFITVLATAPPVFTNCPASTNLGCNPASVPGCNLAVGTTADCATTVTCVLNQVTNGCSRTRTITYTATDACGNTNTCTQTITWTVDTTPPVFLSCPTGTTNMGCNPDPASIPHCLVSVQATDNCSSPHVTCSLVQTTNLLTCVRTRTVIYTATDACGNSTNCTQVITWTVDTTPPVFTKIPLASTNLGCNPASIPVCNLDPTNVFAIDDCPTNDIPVITCASVDATNGCVRTRTLTYTATGGCGNTATKTTVITWTVDTLPVLSIGLQGTNVVVSWPVPCCNPFVLEQTPSLTLPITWTPAPTPIVGGGSNTVTVPIGTGNTFYRLRYP